MRAYKNKKWDTLTPVEFDEFAIENDRKINRFENLHTFTSSALALESLGTNKAFYFAENNTDGVVVSPNSKILGITKE